MIDKEELECILNSSPYPIVFVDTNHIIKFLNTTAKHLYYTQRGYDDLIGKSFSLVEGPCRLRKRSIVARG